MKYKQLVSPDLTITEAAGLCLSFSRRAFGAPVVEKTAWEGWSKAEYRHEDRDWPSGVSIPVWFDWWGQLPGDKQKFQYGHVAVLHTDGKVYSSPLSGKGRAWFASVDDLARSFGGGMKYVGWSEDISNVRVVKKEDYMITARVVESAYRTLLARECAPKQKQDLIRAHETMESLEAWIMSLQEYKDKQKLADNGDLNFRDFMRSEYRGKLIDKNTKLTVDGASVLYRLFYGMGISEYGFENRIGKQTFDEALRDLRAQPGYKEHVEKLLKDPSEVINNLPAEIREALMPILKKSKEE